MTRVGQFVKRKRTERSLSQGDLARQLGVDPQYVSNVERGIHKNPMSFCALLSKVLTAKEMLELHQLMGKDYEDKIESKTEQVLGNVSGKLRRGVRSSTKVNSNS